MIDFLHPVLGLAALAVAIPIALHLMRRREARRVSFPAVRYLRQAEQQHAQRLRLRYLLLLTARLLIVLLLAVAAMGPLLGHGGPTDHRPTALAIVIDESQSASRLLGNRRLLDLYAERARIDLEQATHDDRVALFSAVRPEDAAVALGAGAVREYLVSLRAAAALADLPGAIRQAAAWLGSERERAREMHVFTDLQRVSLTAGASSPTKEPPEAGRSVSVIVYAPDVRPQGNGAAGDAEPEVAPLSVGLQAKVSLPLHWFGPLPAESSLVRLVTGDESIVMAEAAFGATALLSLPPQDSGWVQGYVELDRHGLAADDRRYFTWHVRPAPRVAVLGDAGRFLGHALDALEQGGRVRQMEPAAAESWLATAGTRLEEGLAAGRSVIVVPPADPVDLPRLNSRLGRARVPWRYRSEEGSGAARLAEGAGVVGLAGLEFRQLYRLIPSGLTQDTVMLRLSSGEPWLVRGTTAAGAAYLLLASPLTPEASELPVSAVMVPFLDALVGDWARRGGIGPTAFEGLSPIRLPPRADLVQQPDGSRTPAEGGAWYRAAEAGNYAVLDGERRIMAFSVNAPLIESDLAPGQPSELERILPAAHWSWHRETSLAGWQQGIFRSRRGRPAWRPLVVLLLVLSIGEASLAAAGRRRRETKRR